MCIFTCTCKNQKKKKCKLYRKKTMHIYKIQLSKDVMLILSCYLNEICKGWSEHFLTQYIHRRSYIRTYTYPYVYTHAHPTAQSTSERLSRFIILRLTKSPQTRTFVVESTSPSPERTLPQGLK